ncbi:Transcriptional regulator, LysR family [Roseibacterium elongatum DSM 19469]|uniref:Transcriptional regulator, LysR family n=1 Tax=Roseicyclus elongatus DSM 19469 TaxID=1294273 RepID=W8S3E9_9RHOB|nr:LysR family transcriptional regulator [Roseibacterium elongatum]AHM03291.1 Transcriptional regulator, LysR family [Roseibacterium elongatum DSM 19469]
MDQLNYHHLRYFREVAHQGNLTRAAERLNLSQSALSSQIKTLEARLGHPLFDRVGRELRLSEVGRIALDHADRIFGTGEELLATLARVGPARTPLRIGALSTLSRNFQMEFLRPVLGHPETGIVLRSGNAQTLLDALKSLALDVVLTNEAPIYDENASFTAHRIADQPVSLHGVPGRLHHDSLQGLLQAEPFIVPTESTIRTGFDALAATLGVRPHVAAEVDDMAMVRLLTREGIGVAIAPPVVFADEIASGTLSRAPFDLDILETFFAVTVPRSFPHPMLKTLLAQA